MVYFIRFYFNIQPQNNMKYNSSLYWHPKINVRKYIYGLSRSFKFVFTPSPAVLQSERPPSLSDISSIENEVSITYVESNMVTKKIANTFNFLIFVGHVYSIILRRLEFYTFE